MKRLIFALMLIVGIATTTQAQQLYEFTYKNSNHYSDRGPINYHTQSQLNGKKLYFVYNGAQDTFSLADSSGDIKYENLLKWDPQKRQYYGYDSWYIMWSEQFEAYCISSDRRQLRFDTSDNEGYDISHNYYLSRITDI